MWPRNSRDWRTLLWTAVMPVVVATMYLNPDLVIYLSPLACYLALCAGVIAHNHNHCGTFPSRVMNRFFANWLSLFYGYPTFAWVPTHNLNHHKYVNRAGDATITWRYSNRHTFWIAATYFFVSSYWQSDPIKDYIRKARTQNRKLYGQILFQYALWAGMAVTLLVVASAMHGFRTGLGVWLGASVIPAVFALWTIMLFNYEQHVHTDPWSEHNHSRSWNSKLLNFMLFNNGLHAAHHENPGVHWTELNALHAELEPKIHPALVERSMWWYFAKNYLLRPFGLGSTQIGRAPFDVPDGTTPDTATADVELEEAGVNAAMAPRLGSSQPTSA